MSAMTHGCALPLTALALAPATPGAPSAHGVDADPDLEPLRLRL